MFTKLVGYNRIRSSFSCRMGDSFFVCQEIFFVVLETISLRRRGSTGRVLVVRRSQAIPPLINRSNNKKQLREIKNG